MGGLGPGQSCHRHRQNYRPFAKASEVPSRCARTSRTTSTWRAGGLRFTLRFGRESRGLPQDAPFDFEGRRSRTHNALGLALAKKRNFFWFTSECYGDPEISPQHRNTGVTSTHRTSRVYDEAKRYAGSDDHGVPSLSRRGTLASSALQHYGPRMRLNDGRALRNFVFQALERQAAHDLWRRKTDAQFLLRQ